MANEIRGGGGIRPGQLPGQQPASLQEKEQAKLQGQQRPLGKLSPQDAARLAQQAGLVKGQRKGPKGLDLGDSSRAPIPLPDDDTDTEVWSPEGLEEAQQDMSLASTHLGEAQKPSPQPMAETITATSFVPTEEGLAALEALAGRAAPEPLALDEVTTSVKSLFDIELSADAPVAHKLLAAGLVVAGEASAIEADARGVNEQKLAGGIQKVAERSNQAVGEAQKMSKGVSRELNLRRTFVVKR